jgi:plastocyanin
MRQLSVLLVLAALAGLAVWLPAGSVTAAADGGWGDVKGQVVFAGGTIPERKPVEITADKPHCHAQGDILTEDWVVNKDNRGVKNAFVWLAPSDPSVPLPIHPDLQEVKVKEVVVDQPMCAFVPHAVALREGQTVVVKNSAPVAHNVRWTGTLRNGGGNVIVPPGGQHLIKDLRADRIPLQLNCDIHKWMRGWLRVYDHPYYAVTDDNGNFTIANAPAGNCQLIVWHESVGWRGGAAGRNGETIAVKPGGTDLGKLDLKPTE